MEEVRIQLGGSTLSIDVGRVAKQANGSALVRYVATFVLATALEVAITVTMLVAIA